jgi:hypothetical protein
MELDKMIETKATQRLTATKLNIRWSGGGVALEA